VELRRLVDLCNFCALCPCPPVRANIIEAKTRFIDRDGLKFGVRTIEDVERVAKLCGAFPQLTNMLLHGKATGDLIKKVAGIHPARQIPTFPGESFPQWIKKKGQHTRPKKNQNRKIAYFAGCTANYLFPEVPRAVVNVFQYNMIEVLYPEQKCCGMPALLEGDRQLTLEFVGFKQEFHDTSIHLGKKLMAKFKELAPEMLVTDCLSCRLQFKQLLPYMVYHPIEILKDAYKGNHDGVPKEGN
jgi:glycerol-3-phosphate dehydrogenase subunit C